jgi:hypothetical protein
MSLWRISLGPSRLGVALRSSSQGGHSGRFETDGEGGRLTILAGNSENG